MHSKKEDENGYPADSRRISLSGVKENMVERCRDYEYRNTSDRSNKKIRR